MNSYYNAKSRLPLIFGIGFLLICLPMTARADAGTPLMWATMLHLVVGNLFIGIFEGWLLGWIFKLPIYVCILAMIPANYFSAWVGGCFLNDAITGSLPFTLYNTWHWVWAMVVFTFIMTLILEWPFVFFCFRKEPDRLKKSLQGNLLVNSLSYVLLFGWYWMASGTSLYTKMHVVQPSAMTYPKAGQVYFISETSDGVCRLDLHSRQVEKVAALSETNTDARLFVKPSAIGSDNWDIWDSTKTNLVCSNLQVTAAQSERDADNQTQVKGNWFNFGPAPKLATSWTSDWSFETGFWPIEGMHGTNQKTGERIYFSLETPFVSWVIRNATQLPEDYVVFQLGEDQICILEIATKKIALLTRGHGPVVVIPKEKVMN